MFFSGHDDEDIDFNISGAGGSKLANLFSSDDVGGDERKQSLTYTAPKQPKKTEASVSSSTSSPVSVLHAVAVHTFKLENQQYASQGKLGAAILGNHESCTYQLLLYKGQQQHVAMASISPTFAYNVQANSYANFYSNKRECWSMRFDTEQTSAEFARQVALAKANSVGPSGFTSLIIQDLHPGQDDPLDVGHSAEIRYTGWLLTNNTLGQVFDSNVNSPTAMRLKLGKGKVIKGWEEGLIGAKKGGRRLLVVPPSLGYGAQGVPDKIPPNSTLIFDLQVIKTKHSRDSRSSTPVTSLSGGEDSRHSTPPVPDITATIPTAIPDDSVRARGASLSEQLSQSPRSEKAQLISRMARMGMPLLPMQATQPSSESENEDEVSSKGHGGGTPLRTASPKPSIKPRPAPSVPVAHIDPPISHPMAASQPPQQVALLQQQQPYGIMGQTYPYQFGPQSGGQLFGPQSFQTGAVGAPLIAPPAVSADSSHWPLLMAESRTQNSEVRITLGKISDRVDMVLSKLGEMKTQSSNDPVAYMESNILLQNIQRIVQENNKLKADAEDKSSKILSLNDKICDLLQRNQKLVEDSNHLLEKRSDTFQHSSTQSQTRLLTLEEEKSKLSAELSEALSRVTELQLQLQRQQAQQLSKGGVQLNMELEEQDTVISGLQQNVRSLRNDKKELMSKMEALQDQIQDLQMTKQTLEKSMERTQKKLADEKKRSQEELEDIRNSYKEETDNLRQKLAKSKTGSSEQVDVEALEKGWREERDGLKGEIRDVRASLESASSDKEHLVEQLADMHNKLDSARKAQPDNSRVSELEEEVAGLQVWKTKYEELVSGQETMKEDYENRLRNLASSASLDLQLVEAKLKKAMNVLYRGLQRDFQATDSYTTEEALKLILNKIKLVTTAVLSESSEEKQAPESSPTASSTTVVGDKPLSVPENTPPDRETPSPKASHQKVPPQADSSVEEPTQQNGLPVPKGNETELKTSVKPGSSPKSEDSDDLSWKPQPPPPPLFDEDDEEDEDDWLK